MSNKLKSTLAATLAATLATGMVVPAMATGKNSDADALYAAAYNATIKAQETGEQEDIDEARKAIAALEGTDAAFAIGEFSRLVDAPQQVILSKIVDGILANQKEPKQSEINEIRELIVGLKNVDSAALNWVNQYSSALDIAQQILIDEAVKATEKAQESGLQADIDEAQKLIDSLKTATNNEGVVTWAKAYEKDELDNLKVLTIESAKVENSRTIKINFNKVVDATTVTPDSFSIVEADSTSKEIISDVKVSEDKKSVEVVVLHELGDEDYNITVEGIKDEAGNAMEKTTKTVRYESAKPLSIAIKNTKIVRAVDKELDIRDFITIKDEKGRDVTTDYKDQIVVTSNNAALITSTVVNDGKIEEKGGKIFAGKEGKVKVNISILGKKVSTGEVNLTLENEKASTFQGFVITNNVSDVEGKVLSKVKDDDKLSTLKVGAGASDLVMFYKNQNNEELSGVKTGFEVKNLTPALIEVEGDKANGYTLTPQKAGTAKLEVKYEGITKEISIKVSANSVVTGLKLEKDSFNLAQESTRVATPTYKAEVVDQYGDKIEVGNTGITGYAQEFVVKYYERGTYKEAADLIDDSILDIAEITINNSGEYKVESGTKAGTVKAQIEVKATWTEDGKAKEKVLTQNLTATTAGDKVLDEYKVEIKDNKDTTLDLNADKDDSSIDVKVTGLNSKGNDIGEVTKVKAIIVDEDGQEEVVDAVYDTNENIIELNTTQMNKKGTYTVKLIHGSYEFKKLTITVVNTTPAPTTVQFKGSGVELKAETEDALNAALKDIINVYDQNGKKVDFESVQITKGYAQNGNTIVIGELKVKDSNGYHDIKVPNHVITYVVK